MRLFNAKAHDFWQQFDAKIWAHFLDETFSAIEGNHGWDVEEFVARHRRSW